MVCEQSGERASAGDVRWGERSAKPEERRAIIRWFRRSCFSEGERRASIRMRRSLGLSVRETGRAESEQPLGFAGPALAKESGERASAGDVRWGVRVRETGGACRMAAFAVARRNCLSGGERRASIRWRRAFGCAIRETGKAESEHPLGFAGAALAKESGERASV